MSPLVVFLAAATIGIDAGWEPLADGGHEYTIQIEPTLLSVLKDGTDLVSEVPQQVNVRRFRITVRTGALARIDGEPAAPVSPPVDAAPVESPPSKPLENAPAFPAETPRAEEPPAAQTVEPEVQPKVGVPDGPAMPARFDDKGAAAQPLTPAAKSADLPPAHSTEKPRLDASAPGATSRPWLPLVVAAALLACSLGANVFLGWIYLEARRRYRDAVGRLRAAPAG